MADPHYDLPSLVAQQLHGVHGRLVDVGCGKGAYLVETHISQHGSLDITCLSGVSACAA